MQCTNFVTSCSGSFTLMQSFDKFFCLYHKRVMMWVCLESINQSLNDRYCLFFFCGVGACIACKDNATI